MNKFVVVAIAILLIALFVYFQKKRFLYDAALAQGTVTEIVETGYTEVEGELGDMHYAPTVEFTTHTGEQVIFTSKVANSSILYRVGQPVSVRYSADNPTQAIIDNFWGRWSLVVILCITSGFFLLLAFLKRNG